MCEIQKLNATIESQKDDILSIRDVIIKKLQEDNNKLQDRVSVLEDKVGCLTNEVSLLKVESIATTRNSFSNDQYMRQNNIEIDGIPNAIDDSR